MTTATPLARYGAMRKARVASGYATAGELHHVRGHDLAGLNDPECASGTRIVKED